MSVPELDGLGTEDRPHFITSAEDLDLIREDLSAHYIQVADIDLSGGDDGGDPYSIDPIGKSSDTAFTGSFNGNGYSISGLTLDLSEDEVGLFGYANEAEFENVALEDVDVVGGTFTGALVGWAEFSFIRDCYVSGSVEGVDTVGGLVGDSYDGSRLVGCRSDANVSLSGAGGSVGGVVGWVNHRVHDCTATGNITGGSNAGGCIGYMEAEAYATKCYSYGDVESRAGEGGQIGGCVGWMGNDARIIFCGSEGTVEANDNSIAGGLVGGCHGDVRICYAEGVVNGDGDVGGLVGISWDDGGRLVSTHFTGEVNGSSGSAAGILGNCDTGDFDISNSYCACEVETSDGGTVEPMAVDNSGSLSVTTSFWDEDVFSQSDGYSDGDYNGTGLPTSDMTGTELNTDMADWEYNFTYMAREGEYPTVQHKVSFEISSFESLKLTYQYPSANFTLTDDIDASASADMNDGRGWDVYSNDFSFAGSLDGNGHSITGLYAEVGGNSDGVGLIPNADPMADIRNIDVSWETLSNSGASVGGVVGYVTGIVSYGDAPMLRLQNISVEADIVGANCSGVIAGLTGSGMLAINCEYEGSLAPQSDAGGISHSVWPYEQTVLVEGCSSTVSIEASSYGGGIVGGFSDSTDTASTMFAKIRRCETEAVINGGNNIGGVCGEHASVGDRSGIISCDATVEIETGAAAGGMYGYGRDGGRVLGCTVTGTIVGEYGVGGVLGQTASKTVKRCYANVEVGGEGCGGFAGNIDENAVLRDCYVVGTVTGDMNAGGFANSVGESSFGDEYTADVKRCYAAVKMTESGDWVNPFANTLIGTMENCYYDSSLEGSDASDADEYGDGLTALTTDQMTGEDARDYMEGFDFTGVWGLTQEYPEFSADPIFLTVEVMDYDGTPIENQLVTVSGTPVGYTDGSGVVSVNLPPNNDYTVTWVNSDVSEELVDGFGEETLTFRNANLKATVSDVNGNPMQGEIVVLDNMFMFETDATGSLETGGIPPKVYRMRWVGGGVNEYLDASDEWDITREFQYAGLTVSVNHPLTGEPVQNAIVDVQNSIYRTDENGEVEITDLDPGEYDVSVMGFWDANTGRIQQGQMKELNFDGEGTELTVGVEVVSESASKPLEDIDVLLTQANAKATTDESGEAELFAADFDEMPKLVVARDDKRYKTAFRDVDPEESRHDFRIVLSERTPMRK